MGLFYDQLFFSLQETGDVIEEVIKEMYHIYRSFGNMTDVMLISAAEVGYMYFDFLKLCL